MLVVNEGRKIDVAQHNERNTTCLELAAHVVDDSLRVRPGSVQLVDKRHPRHRVPFHLPVDGERLRLHP